MQNVIHSNLGINMSTITSTIFIGATHPNHSGINPTHLIVLSENSRPSFQIYNLSSMKKVGTLIPTSENMMDDLFLIISSCVLKSLRGTECSKLKNGKNFYELFDQIERNKLYELSKNSLKGSGIKVVLNLLERSHLLNQIDQLKSYEIDYEVTTTTIKREFNTWSNKVETKN